MRIDQSVALNPENGQTAEGIGMALAINGIKALLPALEAGSTN